MKVAICDDEKAWQNEIIKYLNEYQNIRETEISIKCFSSGVSCCKAQSGEYDIIFMDYKMDKMNGIEAAREIRKTASDSAIIFISAYPEAALDAYEVKTFRFLSKPIKKAKLFKALDDYIDENYTNSHLILKAHDRILRIRISEIVYAEAKKTHTVIHTEKEDYEILTNLKAVENMLPKDKFVRCHNSYITSLQHIKYCTKKEIYYNDRSSVDIGRSRSVKFKAVLHEYTSKNDTGED